MSKFILTMSACTNPAFLKVVKFLEIVLQIACIALPIILIVMISIDIFKSVVAGKEEDMKKNFSLAIKRIIYCVCLFFVPTIVSLVLNIVNTSITSLDADYQGCFENTKYIDYYQALYDANSKQEKEEIQNSLNAKISQDNEKLAIKKSANPSSDSSSSEGSFVGQTYNLTDSQLRGIAYICQKEQGSEYPSGAAAEASLMANLFELKGSSYGTGADGLFNYVANSGWFFDSKSRVYNTTGATDEIVAVVKDVLVHGNRTLPLYIDEHDCIDCGSYGFDIIKLDVNGTIITDSNGLLDKNNYIQDQTIIYNSAGKGKDYYTFYTFPSEVSDPFGYTPWAKNKYDTLNNS